MALLDSGGKLAQDPSIYFCVTQNRHILPLPAGSISLENYCMRTLLPVTACNTRGTFLGCVQRVWVCSMVMLANGVVTRVDTIALHKCPDLGLFGPFKGQGNVGVRYRGRVPLDLVLSSNRRDRPMRYSNCDVGHSVVSHHLDQMQRERQ